MVATGVASGDATDVAVDCVVGVAVVVTLPVDVVAVEADDVPVVAVEVLASPVVAVAPREGFMVHAASGITAMTVAISAITFACIDRLNRAIRRAENRWCHMLCSFRLGIITSLTFPGGPGY